MGRLVREATKGPEKLQKLQDREHLMLRKRQAIEEAATGMLRVNRPILNVQ